MTTEFDEWSDVPQAHELGYPAREVAVTNLPKQDRVRMGFGHYRIDADADDVIMNVEDMA